jgi:GNAT superfamily N-acetyltransferase
MLLIRAATRADCAHLERILTRTFLADHTRYLPEPVDPEFVARFSADLVSRRWAAMALALLDDQPVGMLYTEPPKIEALNVLPAFQRRGIGTALMDWIEPALAAAGDLIATLDTQEANAPARRFYESRGYRTASHWLQTQFTKVPIPMVTLERSLRAP